MSRAKRCQALIPNQRKRYRRRVKVQCGGRPRRIAVVTNKKRKGNPWTKGWKAWKRDSS